MEFKGDGKDKFFIVTRGKARKGFSRGCIGRVEAVMHKGELMGLLYGGGSSGNPKSGDIVKREDTYPLTRHQAQLLLFVSPSSKRLELLCNPQLFSAICVLSQDDLVVVKHKKGHQPGLVRNLMLIGKKENQGDLLMLGFEVEFVDSDQTVSPKKPAPLPLFSAADIIQVVPAHSVGIGPRWKDSYSEGLNRKAVSRINSMPNMGSRERQVRGINHLDQNVTQTPTQSPSHHPFEVGSIVEVTSNTGITVYGVIRWMGVLSENKNDWAGIELDYEVNNCTDGTYGGQQYFTCKEGRALFVPLTKCSPDGRFLCPPSEKETLKATDIPPVIPLEETDENVPPIPESEALSLLVGKMKGIQGHYNSCYLDATLFSLFSSSMTLDSVCHKPAGTEKSISRSLKKDIVNRLRRQGFVPAESVMNFRKQLGCDTFVTEEKDPEEFITILLQRVLCMKSLLKLRSNNNTSQDAYTFQIILDKEQVTQTPTVQQLLDISLLSCGLKFEEIPSCLMVHMPRFGKKYKMFPHIIPSTEFDITDLLYNSPRECFLCGRLAEYECPQCLQDRKLQPGRIKQYCTTCKTQVHTHPSRQSHCPRALAVPAEVPADAPVPRHKMQLFAVLCIHTSHYVSFVKYGPGPRSWLFFDSMADRCVPSGDDQSGYNIPEIRACPEVGDFLSQSEEELARADPSQAGEPVRRLLSDSYMYLYQSASMALYR
ncbi:ubiquitin carboxyl-terminal hydrolase CYLD isoform X2 [Salmo salar]|uniref:Ubiquitin carboxyl-terminal hydrolase CYLD n=1 Tax=Salmo salar TaxID=8030 RepID=A0A1S3P2U7_SALSA|nr:ubiquitin carboxyl-terminal hydrolase CYLD-like isoform X2 [Salmo salar]